jgi:hypothetical protein
MQIMSSEKQREADLHWLAFLLTGRRELSIDMAAADAFPQDGASLTFSTWMVTWSRRVIISKALAAIRDELAASALRTNSKHLRRPALPGRDWELDRDTTKVDLEKALFAIDVFPRAALLLSIFERMPLADAAVLLDAEPELIRKARAIGLMELTSRLARMQGWTSAAGNPLVVPNETQYA